MWSHGLCRTASGKTKGIPNTPCSDARIEWSLLHCVSQYPLCTSHKFPTHRVRCTLFTVLCQDQTVPILDKMASCLTTLFWTILWHAITLIANVWSLLEKIVSLLRNVENILTSACVSWCQSHRLQHRNECQTFACLLFNGSVSNRDERTFHGVHYNYCYVVYKCKLTPLNLARMFLKEQKKYIVVD